MEHARNNRLWNWFRPHPANLCNLDVFLAVELFVFAEAESRGFLSDDVLRCPNMMSLSSLLRPVTSTTSDMDDTRYEEAKKIMKNGFGECRDVTEHLHRMLLTSSGGSNEALKAMHAVTTVASAARQPWHIPCPCPLPDLRWRTVNAINIAPAGWYETDKPEAIADQVHQCCSGSQLLPWYPHHFQLLHEKLHRHVLLGGSADPIPAPSLGRVVAPAIACRVCRSELGRTQPDLWRCDVRSRRSV